MRNTRVKSPTGLQWCAEEGGSCWRWWLSCCRNCQAMLQLAAQPSRVGHWGWSCYTGIDIVPVGLGLGWTAEWNGSINSFSQVALQYRHISSFSSDTVIGTNHTGGLQRATYPTFSGYMSSWDVRVTQTELGTTQQPCFFVAKAVSDLGAVTFPVQHQLTFSNPKFCTPLLKHFRVSGVFRSLTRSWLDYIHMRGKLPRSRYVALLIIKC